MEQNKNPSLANALISFIVVILLGAAIILALQIIFG